MRRLSIGQVYELRKKFFGSELEEAPKDKERKEKAVAILTECYDSFKKTFNYRILRINGEDYDEVCEGAFLVALGKLGNMKTNQVPILDSSNNLFKRCCVFVDIEVMG